MNVVFCRKFIVHDNKFVQYKYSAENDNPE